MAVLTVRRRALGAELLADTIVVPDHRAEATAQAYRGQGYIVESIQYLDEQGNEREEQQWRTVVSTRQ